MKKRPIWNSIRNSRPRMAIKMPFPRTYCRFSAFIALRAPIKKSRLSKRYNRGKVKNRISRNGRMLSDSLPNHTKTQKMKSRYQSK